MEFYHLICVYFYLYNRVRPAFLITTFLSSEPWSPPFISVVISLKCLKEKCHFYCKFLFHNISDFTDKKMAVIYIWKLFIFLDSVTFFFNAPFFSLYSSLNAVLNSVFAFGYAICPLNCLSNPFFQMYRLRVNRCAYFQAQFLLSYFSIEVASSSFLLLGFLDL